MADYPGELILDARAAPPGALVSARTQAPVVDFTAGQLVVELIPGGQLRGAGVFVIGRPVPRDIRPGGFAFEVPDDAVLPLDDGAYECRATIFRAGGQDTISANLIVDATLAAPQPALPQPGVGLTTFLARPGGPLMFGGGTLTTMLSASTIVSTRTATPPGAALLTGPVINVTRGGAPAQPSPMTSGTVIGSTGTVPTKADILGGGTPTPAPATPSAPGGFGVQPPAPVAGGGGPISLGRPPGQRQTGFRMGNDVKAMVNGEEAFSPTLLADLKAADAFVYLAFWQFTPDLRIGPPDPDRAVTIGDILIDRAKNDVPVRVLLWDFKARLAINILSKVLPLAEGRDEALLNFFPGPPVETRPEEARLLFGTIVKDLGRTWEWYMAARQELRRSGQEDKLVVQFVPHPEPGVPEPELFYRGVLPENALGRTVEALLEGSRANIGSHHQKLIVVGRQPAEDTASAPATDDIPEAPPMFDDRDLRIERNRLIAHVLGLNAAPDYWDNSDHQRTHPNRFFLENGQRIPIEQPWHDVSVRIEGPTTVDIEAEFIRRWNLNALPRDIIAAASDPAAQPVFPDGKRAQFLVNIAGPDQLQLTDELTAALVNARRSIFIVDQYFSDRDAMRAIIAAYRMRETEPQKLRILLLTNAPETFGLYDRPSQPMEVYRFVNFTMLRLATCEAVFLRGGTRLARAVGERWDLNGDRFALDDLTFTTAAGQTIEVADITDYEGACEPAYLYSTELDGDGVLLPIYIHAKVTIIDDEICHIGTANYSVRSLNYDSEANLVVQDRDFARALRERLFADYLGEAPPGDLDRDAAAFLNRARRNRFNLVVADDLLPPKNAGARLVAYPLNMPDLIGAGGPAADLFRSEVLSILVPILNLPVSVVLGGASLDLTLHDLLKTTGRKGTELILRFLYRLH